MSSPRSRAVASQNSFVITTSIVLYSICSGSLLLVNKVLLTFIPSAPLVTAIQCAVCIVSIGSGAYFFGRPSLGTLTRPLLEAYGLYSVLFVLGIYSNMRALEVTNVDTVIVFRSTIPLLVSFADWALMGREIPSLRSIISMLVVVIGCSLFVATDAAFHIQGWRAYGWVFVYILCIAGEMIFGKMITSKHDATLGASVFLTNSFAIIPFLVIGASTGELSRGMHSKFFTFSATSVLLASCALSAGIGFTSWWCRSLVSATTFTVVGTVNKVLTVMLNIAVWSKHASALGTFFLLVSLAGGSFYEQAPLRQIEAADTGEVAGV